MTDAVRRVSRLSENVGMAFVVVDAIDVAASLFYECFGFRAFLDDSRTLFLPTISADKVTGIAR